MVRGLIITIDGPAGAGKSTLAKALAKELGYKYLDTGAMYRAVALLAIRKGIAPQDAQGLNELIRTVQLEVDDEGRIKVNGQDLTEELRDEKIGMMASLISQKREVREALWVIQRKIGERGGIVAEGRDTGTMVFPQADVKFYLDASLEERARRRFLDLLNRGKTVRFEEVLEDVKRRDHQDANRNLAPLRVPKGAFYIDSTDLSVNEVLDLMLEKVREKLGCR